MFNFTDSSGNTDYAPYLSLLGGGFTAASDLTAASQTASLMRMNAGIAIQQGAGAAEAGAEQADVYRQRLAQTVGKQQASIGGANITTSGSALRALEATQQIGAQDVARIQLNAARKTWGFDVSAQGDEYRANLAESAGRANALGSLITSGARAYGQWDTGI